MGSEMCIRDSENDGAGTFGAQTIITNNAANPQFISTGDIDGDGDLDMISASAINDQIRWYNNIDGVYYALGIVTTYADDLKAGELVDIDNDGDLDVLSASSSDDEVAWYPNSGNGSFGAQQFITTSAKSVNDIVAADLDNCLLYTSPSPRDGLLSRMPSSA